jgi:all-trans-retinol 13,14-reductase
VHERGAEYEHFKDQLSSYLLDILYETVPETKGRVEFYQLGTPLSEVTFLSSYHGGSYGTKCTPSMFDEINHGWTTNPRTKIPGLYLAGSDAFLPAVCGAMVSFSDTCINKWMKLGFLPSNFVPFSMEELSVHLLFLVM